uniref:Golgin-84 n=1 Tax=Caenorhabditis tropicalis TaxID=1561998 RepID=A0A1I7UKJ8_9PELO
MSWLSKVSDIAGAAENLLNKLDEKTGDAIQQARDVRPRTRQGSTASIPATVISMPEHVITEDLGRPAPSIPSRAQSDYTGAGWRVQRNYEQSSSITQPGATAASESWTMVLNSNAVKTANRDEEDTRSQRSVGGRSVASIKTASELATQDSSPNIKSQLFAKDSQISVLKNKLSDTERKLEKRSQDYYEMKAEKEMLEKRVENQKVSNQEMDSLQELKLARQKAQEQKEKVVDELNMHKRKIVGLEEEIRAMVEQLRLAKFNLNENKKEFDEYKNKAQKILSAKEKLVESLKSEQGIGSSERPVHLLQAEVEEIRVERDLTKADLESAQLQVYTLRSDMEELEAQIRDLQSQLSEQKRTHLEERQSWDSTIGLLNEKVECSRIEHEFTKQEMKRLGDQHNSKMTEKDNEYRRIIGEMRARIRDEQSRQEDDGTAQLSDMLLAKQQQLEDVMRTNQVLNVRLERLQKASNRDTTIPIDQNSSPMHTSSSHPLLSNINHSSTRNALQTVDSTAFKLLSMLRSHPSARLFFVLYFIMMHLWAFFIVLTYTPEIH